MSLPENKDCELYIGEIGFEEWAQKLQRIVINNADKSGNDFLKAITIELADTLEADYAFIGKVTGSSNTKVKTVALCVKGEIAENFEYDLAGTPCAGVVGREVCVHPCNVIDLFPEDILLQDMSVEAYLGVPIFDSKKNPLGLIVAMYCSPLKETRLPELMIQLIANKAASEIELLHADKSLKDSRQQFQELFDNSPNSLWEKDFSLVKKQINSLKEQSISDFSTFFTQNPSKFLNLVKKISVKTVNNETLLLFEAQNKEQFTIEIMETFSEGSLEFFENCILNLIKGKRRGTGICSAKTLKENEIIVEICWSVPEQYSETWEKVFLSVQDITDRIKMEEQLRQSEKMQAIGQLAGGIAHDFNNQLTGIVGYADILSTELTDNTKLSRYVENILLAAKRSSDLTSQLLAFARKGKYLSTIIDIHEIIDEVIEILERTIDKRITIQKHLDIKIPTMKGDPSQIQNALINIALNARDAMPDGGELVISTSISQLDKEYCKTTPYEIEPGNYIAICIIDNGIGMNQGVQRRIFEPFFSTKDQGKGTGMGLASVYGTVKNHGGTINVYSEPGRGTTMKMYLPHTSLNIDFEDKATKLVESPDVESPDVDTHILLVDDEKFVIDTATIMLEKSGYKVSAYSSGCKAIEHYRSNWENIDLVILDMVMPKISGREIFKKLKKINPHVRVLLSSGYSIDGEAQQILDQGVMGFIQKPYRKTELSQKIAEIMEKGKS